MVLNFLAIGTRKNWGKGVGCGDTRKEVGGGDKVVIHVRIGERREMREGMDKTL